MKIVHLHFQSLRVHLSDIDHDIGHQKGEIKFFKYVYDQIVSKS